MKNRFDTTLNWDDLRVFVALGAAGTLTHAAQMLGLSVATVSRRLERLESAVDRRLFHRAATGLTLVPEAEPLLARAQAVMGDVFDFLRSAEASRDGLSGPVTINTLDTVMERVLAPRLGAFRREHPGIQLIIRADLRVISLASRTADIALRVVPPSEERVVRRRLRTLDYGLFASPEYIARRGVPTPHRLHGHDIVTYDERMDGLPDVRWLRERCRPDDLALRLNTLAGVVAAVEQGAGVALLPRMLASSRLVSLYDGQDLPGYDLWLAVHEDVQYVPRVRAVIEFVERCVRTHHPADTERTVRSTGSGDVSGDTSE